MADNTIKTIGICGSAARHNTHHKIDEKVLTKLIESIYNILHQYQNNCIVVSGGAAFVDHIAVSLFLQNKISNLYLALPAAFDFNKHCYIDHNDGKISNYYHNLYSKQLQLIYNVNNYNSLYELNQVLQHGNNNGQNCTYSVCSNFKARNMIVARSNILIAASWGDKPSGGTLYTYNNHNGIKHYINLYDLK